MMVSMLGGRMSDPPAPQMADFVPPEPRIAPPTSLAAVCSASPLDRLNHGVESPRGFEEAPILEDGAMKKSPKFSPEVRERAVRPVLKHRAKHPSQWAAIESIAGKIGCVPQTLHTWLRQHEVNAGQRDGVSTADAQRIKDLERENRELRKANEILKLASAFFAQAELDRRIKS
jgi:transposase-like protein